MMEFTVRWRSAGHIGKAIFTKPDGIQRGGYGFEGVAEKLQKQKLQTQTPCLM